MKKLSVFFVKSYIGPFLATFFISMFMLVMQFLWKYIDDLMGKGLEVSIIMELLFYVSASLLPLALPLAILLSSLMVMGNLGETNELTALKSSGLSIYKILRPLTIVTIFIALGTFYFANYVIPVANYKWHSIIWDIQEKKMASFLRPGRYTQDIQGFSIKINEGKNNSFKRMIIHDRRMTNEIKTIVADSGEFFQSENGEFLFFKLYDGKVIEELNSSPDFIKEGNKNTFPSRKSDFKAATYKMDMSGFKLQRTKDDLFKNDYEMLNVFQINKIVDSLRKEYADMMQNLSYNTKIKHSYFRASKKYTTGDENSPIAAYIFNKNQEKAKGNQDTVVASDTTLVKLSAPIYSFSKMPNNIRSSAIESMKSQLRVNIESLEGQNGIVELRRRNFRRYEIEFHRKFALSFSIIILFFIGAPLGAIVRKGGFGAPVVIAALLFMLYFVLITMGESMASNDVISPALGMWGPNLFLAPFAILLLRSAANDRSISVSFKIFKRKTKSGA